MPGVKRLFLNYYMGQGGKNALGFFQCFLNQMALKNYLHIIYKAMKKKFNFFFFCVGFVFLDGAFFYV